MSPTARGGVLKWSAWIAIYAAWVLASINNHPTWSINLICTGILVLASVVTLAVVFHLLDQTRQDPGLLEKGIPWRMWPWRLSWTVATQIVSVWLIASLLAVWLIQAIYDRNWGPDPRRFGFWTNLFYDSLFLFIHVTAGIVVALAARYWLHASNNVTNR